MDRVASVRKTRQLRQNLKERYGGDIPTSVWHCEYGDDGGIIEYQPKTSEALRQESYGKKVLEGKIDPHLERSAMSVSCIRDGSKTRLSVFPYNICKRTILFYSDPGDIVLDPCAGHNSRMQATWQLGRAYIGYDVSKEFMAFNRQVRDKILAADQADFFPRGGKFITLHEQSSEKMVEQDGSVDLVFTSPPYWCMEWYGDEPEQLAWRDGKPKTYEEFLDGIENIGRESFRVLKPGRFCVFNINDFRYNGKFYLYHADLATRFLRAGFDLHDVVIFAYTTIPFGSIFATRTLTRKLCGKQHEYLMVFRKPGPWREYDIDAMVGNDTSELL